MTVSVHFLVNVAEPALSSDAFPIMCDAAAHGARQHAAVWQAT